MIDGFHGSVVFQLSVISCLMNGPVMKNYVFRSYNLPPDRPSVHSGSCAYKIWEAIRASSAAPGYFEEFTLDGNIHQVRPCYHFMRRPPFFLPNLDLWNCRRLLSEYFESCARTTDGNTDSNMGIPWRFKHFESCYNQTPFITDPRARVESLVMIGSCSMGYYFFS